MTHKKQNIIGIILLILLAIRCIGQVLAALFVGGPGVIIYLILAAVYLAACYGVWKRLNWVYPLIIIIAALDILGAIFVGQGTASFGAMFMDLLLIGLAIQHKKQGNEGTEKKDMHDAPERVEMQPEDMKEEAMDDENMDDAMTEDGEE